MVRPAAARGELRSAVGLWPPPRSWADRLGELRTIHWFEDRLQAMQLVCLVLTVPLLVLLVMGPGNAGRSELAVLLAGCVVGDVATTKQLDARLRWRQDAQRAWDDPDLLATARRYGLRQLPPAAVPPEWARFGDQRRHLADLGMLRGRLRGRELAVVQRTSAEGYLVASVVAVARLRREHPALTICPATTFWGLRPSDDETRFEKLFAVSGNVAAVTPQLRRWLQAHAQELTFELDGHWLACRDQGASPLLQANELGVYLAALRNVAEHLER